MQYIREFNNIKKIVKLEWFFWQAVTNPLQAFFNALVYQRWTRRERFRLGWWYKLKNLSTKTSNHNESVSDVNETSSLLNTKYAVTPHTSINGSQS